MTYSVLINGEAGCKFRPSRGIRQGDLISPYLFLICAEGLSVLLNRAESQGTIHGVQVARGCPSLNHLFFADDNVLFCRAKQDEWQHV